MLWTIQRVNLAGIIIALVGSILWAGNWGTTLVEDTCSIWTADEVVGALRRDAVVNCGLACTVIAFDGSVDWADTDGWAFGFLEAA